MEIPVSSAADRTIASRDRSVERTSHQSQPIVRAIGGRVVRRDDRKIEHLLGYIGNRIRQDPDFEERINRTVKLFGVDYEETCMDEVPPSTRNNHEQSLNASRPSGYCGGGTRYTQRLTVHKEITTFSPDRAHMSDSRPFAGMHNMADQSRRAAYRTPYPRVHHQPNASVGVREIEDDDDEEEENDNTRRGGLQMVSTQRKDTAPMSDDERFFDDNSESVPQRQKRMVNNKGGAGTGEEARNRYRK